jgi:hypothetical protein
MRDLALQIAGVLAILVAVAHGVIAELKVFSRARIEPQRTRLLLRMVWQASTLGWIAIGFLLIAAPSFGSDTARRMIIVVAVVVYGYAAAGNALVTRGRHLGGYLMLGVVALALIGF